MTIHTESLAKSDFNATTGTKLMDLYYGFAQRRGQQYQDFYGQFRQFKLLSVTVTDDFFARIDELTLREVAYAVYPHPIDDSELQQGWASLHADLIKHLSWRQDLMWDKLEEQLSEIAAMAAVHRAVWWDHRRRLAMSIQVCWELLDAKTPDYLSALIDPNATASDLRDDALKMLEGTVATILSESGLNEALAGD